MYNWRARIGYILPGQSNEAVHRDFWRMAPPGVSLVLTAAGIREIDMNEVEGALGRMQRCAEELRDHNVDLVHIGGLPMVTFKGPESAKDLIDKVKTWSGGRPVTTAFQAQMNALRILDGDEVLLVSPNTIQATETFKRSAEAVGVKVLHVECLNLPRSQTSLVSERESYHACAQGLRSTPEAKAIWIPCGNYNVIDLIEALEADFGIPVVTNNQAFLWWVLTVLHLNTHNITGFGRLFQASADSTRLL